MLVEVIFTAEAQEQYQEMPRTIQPRIDQIINRLKNWPNVSGAKPLRGSLAGRWRMRTGDYGVQFYIREAENAVIVEKIGHRAKFYDDQD